MDCVNSLGTEGHGFLHSSGLCRELRASNQPNQGPTALRQICCNSRPSVVPSVMVTKQRTAFGALEALHFMVFLLLLANRKSGLMDCLQNMRTRFYRRMSYKKTTKIPDVSVGLNSRSYVPLANDWWRCTLANNFFWGMFAKN